MLAHIAIISQFTLMEARRNRLILLSLLVLLCGFFLAEFSGNLTLTEHRETQVALLAVFLRLSAVVLVSLFVVSSSLRELQDKMLEMVLALPVRRVSYFLGKLGGFILVASIIVALCGVELLLYAPWQQVALWCLSLWLELLLVVALSLVMLFSFHQIPAALAGVIIIYSASRVIASLSLMAGAPVLAHTSPAEKFMDGFIALLGWLLPDLSRFTQTQWLVYGGADWSVLLPLAVQGFIYLVLLSMVALFDFYRKNF
ncbi:MAG TPA: ABC transporter permease [Thiotrichales bacterium]|nr:ABC transporter permease [Thiotrichales bacterium]